MTSTLVLASTSPQRRAILEQLRIPFDVVAPVYVEHDPPDADPVMLVRDHAEGKARSVHVDGTLTLGVDTTVFLACCWKVARRLHTSTDNDETSTGKTQAPPTRQRSVNAK